jgi:hypothetical protein
MTTLAWEQQDGEPAPAFRHFTIYRDLPPEVRTRDRAYQTYLQDQGQEVTGTEQAPGGWTAECRRWGWVARADMWDAYLVRVRSKVVISRATEVAQKYVNRLLAAIDTAEVPSDWAGIIDAVNLMNTWVNQESLKTVAEVPQEWKPREERQTP